MILRGELSQVDIKLKEKKPAKQTYIDFENLPPVDPELSSHAANVCKLFASLRRSSSSSIVARRSVRTLGVLNGRRWD